MITVMNAFLLRALTVMLKAITLLAFISCESLVANGKGKRHGSQKNSPDTPFQHTFQDDLRSNVSCAPAFMLQKL